MLNGTLKSRPKKQGQVALALVAVLGAIVFGTFGLVLQLQRLTDSINSNKQNTRTTKIGDDLVNSAIEMANQLNSPTSPIIQRYSLSSLPIGCTDPNSISDYWSFNCSNYCAAAGLTAATTPPCPCSNLTEPPTCPPTTGPVSNTLTSVMNTWTIIPGYSVADVKNAQSSFPGLPQFEADFFMCSFHSAADSNLATANTYSSLPQYPYPSATTACPPAPACASTQSQLAAATQFQIKVQLYIVSSPAGGNVEFLASAQVPTCAQIPEEIKYSFKVPMGPAVFPVFYPSTGVFPVPLLASSAL